MIPKIQQVLSSRSTTKKRSSLVSMTMSQPKVSCGRLPKRPRNISGLRNHARCSPAASECNPSTERNERSPTLDDASDEEAIWGNMRSREDEEEEILCWELGNESVVEEDSDSEDIWEDKELQKWLITVVGDIDDPKDRDWLPGEFLRKKRKIG